MWQYDLLHVYVDGNWRGGKEQRNKSLMHQTCCTTVAARDTSHELMRA